MLPSSLTPGDRGRRKRDREWGALSKFCPSFSLSHVCLGIGHSDVETGMRVDRRAEQTQDECANVTKSTINVICFKDAFIATALHCLIKGTFGSFLSLSPTCFLFIFHEAGGDTAELRGVRTEGRNLRERAGQGQARRRSKLCVCCHCSSCHS